MTTAGEERSAGPGRFALGPTLTAVELTKRFHGVPALQDVSLELWPGEVHALVGENGAGKSTLMRILAGEHAADGGSVAINGRPARLGTPALARDLGIALIHQDSIHAPHLSVAENLFLGRLPTRGLMLDRTRLLADATRTLARVGAGDSIPARTPFGALSVAKQQLVDIARALTVDARVVIMDEPTASLSAAETEHLYRIIDELRADGVAILYSSHHLEEVCRLADRATVLRDGRLTGRAVRGELTPASLTTLMLGRELPVTSLPAQSAGNATGELRLDVRKLSGPGFAAVDLTVARGEIVAIYGLVGAGRTEFLHTLYGLSRATSGEIRVDGRVARIGHPRHAIRHGMGLVPEDRKGLGIFAGRSVSDNLLLAGYPAVSRAGVLFGRRTARAAHQLATSLRVKAARLSMGAAGLSGGNQQKLVIGRWLHRDSDILLFDEPTKGIDVGAKADVYRLIDEAAATGKSVLVVTSEPEEALRLGHRVLVMCQGGLVAEFTRDEADEASIRACAFGALGSKDTKGPATS
ncbi:MAG TPA: sugar ABC transporter ATP-binding protein [Pseudonocardiaceae bacterium]|jgi:ribose transport system ATP-binding protein|nr:sugar ABC transporter ATP-binding protein [Pseudonocardiaceae bacterium]